MAREANINATPAATFPVRARATLVACALAALFEGFDNQSMGVAAPLMFRELGIAPSTAAFLFSAATFGLFAGAALGGRTADRFGRTRTLAASLALFGLGSLATIAARDPLTLGLVRLATGLGLGAAMPNFIALATEAVEPGRRLRVVAASMAALPLGGAIAGLLALGERLGWGWRTIFIVGGLPPILLAVALGRDGLRGGAAPAATRGGSRGEPVAAILWRGRQGATTALLWTGFFCTNLVLFLLLNWLPSLIVAMGFTGAQASGASIGFNLAGGAGALLLGPAHAGARRRGWVPASYAGILVGLGALAVVATHGRDFPVALAATVLAGLFTIGAQLILYALAPLYYSSTGRATGVGAALAVGRLGGAVGPLYAGAWLAATHQSALVLAAAVPFVAVAGLAAYALVGRPHGPD